MINILARDHVFPINGKFINLWLNFTFYDILEGKSVTYERIYLQAEESLTHQQTQKIPFFSFPQKLDIVAHRLRLERCHACNR
jgi:hypothetical protein